MISRDCVTALPFQRLNRKIKHCKRVRGARLCQETKKI